LLHLVGCLYYLYQWSTIKQISDNEIYLLIKYIKSVLWREAKCLSYIEEARCLKVKFQNGPCSFSERNSGILSEHSNIGTVYHRKLFGLSLSTIGRSVLHIYLSAILGPIRAGRRTEIVPHFPSNRVFDSTKHNSCRKVNLPDSYTK